VGPGVEGVGVHTLLHSVAVGWLESGVHIKAVADLIGHSSISVTGDIYGHTTDNAARHCRRMERCARAMKQTAVALPVALHTLAGCLSWKGSGV
jgi:hypothetical protein